MALNQKINLTGRNIISTPAGTIDMGEVSLEMNAYIKVESVEATKQSAKATVTYKDYDRSITKFFWFSPDLDGENFIKQAYEYLKTLPEFSGAVDC